MLEVEAKLELMAPGALRERLTSLGATCQGTVNQLDVYFQHPTRDLAATDEAFRFRHEGASMDLTYKGPKHGDGTKVRTEHVVPVTADPTAMLAALGFQPSARISKKRENWTFGELQVTIDHIEGLGNFAEVEAVGDDEAAATEAVEAAINALGLIGAQRYATSYLEMAIAAGLPVQA